MMLHRNVRPPFEWRFTLVVAAIVLGLFGALWFGVASTASPLVADTLQVNTSTDLSGGGGLFTVTGSTGAASMATLAVTSTVTADSGQRIFDVAGTGLTSSANTVSLNINGGATQTCAAGQAQTATTGVGIETCSPFVTSGPETMPGTTITVTDTGTVNDYNPTGLSTANIIRANNASALTVNGIVGGTDGRVLTICAVAGQNVFLANEAAASTAANRIWALNNTNALLASTATNGNACGQLIYDSTSSRWRMTAMNTATVEANTIFQGTLTASAGLTASGGFTVSGSQITLSTATGHISVVGGTAPTLSSCGTSPSTVTGSDIAGAFTVGSSATGCTVTFAATYTNTAGCRFTNRSGIVFTVAPTATTDVITGVGNVSSTVFDYDCNRIQ